MADQPDSKNKRRVKNPDSFRERAQKAVDAESQPGKADRARTAATKPFKPAAGIISQTFAWNVVTTLLKAIGRVLRFLVPRYFRNSWKELKFVTWPNWKQSRQLTFAVLIFAIVFGATIALVDFGLDKLFKSILLK